MKETVFTNYINTIYGAGSAISVFDKHTTFHDDEPIIDAFSEESNNGSDEESEYEPKSDHDESDKEHESEKEQSNHKSKKEESDEESDDIEEIPEQEIAVIETYGNPLPISKKKNNFFDRIKALSMSTTYKDKSDPEVSEIMLIEEYSEPKKIVKSSGKIKFNGGMNDNDIASLMKQYK
jgi:hypothetical protein